MNQTWSGCTTLQFAKLCKELIKKPNNSPVHFVPLGPISKYKLVKDISNELKINVKVNKSESENINRERYLQYTLTGEN